MPKQEELRAGFTLGDWEVLPKQRALRRHGQVVEPEPMVYDVLLALAERDGDVVSNDELIDEVWGGRAIGDEPIQQKISQLRGHFEDKKPYQYIGNMPRKGYRVLKPVELHEPQLSPDSPPGVAAGRSLTRWKTVAVSIAAAFVAVAAWLWIAATPPASMAILPIDNLSGDPANGYIAEGFHRTLGRRLIEIPDHEIKIIRTPHEGGCSDICRGLGVESLLIAAVQIANNTLRIDYQVVDDNDIVLLAGEESGSLDKLFELQERVAQKVYRELAGWSAPELIERVAPDSVAYNTFSRGMYLLEHRFEGQNLEESIRLFERSIELDESYGPAYLGLATAYALLPDYRDMPWQENLLLAVETIDKGVAMDPSIADPAGGIYGFVHYQRKEWFMAESDYERAVTAPVVDSNAFSWYSQMLASVGRLRDSRDVALRGEEIDPDSTVVNSRIAMIYTWLDNKAKAHEYFARAHDLDATGIIHNMAYVLFLYRTGRMEMARDLTFAAARLQNAAVDWIEPVFRGLEDPAHAQEGLAAINAAWAEQQVIPHIVILARTLLGDVEGAMEIAWLLDQPGETFSMEILYIDELAPLRQHPDFMPLLESLGVTDYWRERGCRREDDRVECHD
ncbi:MAG: winged helix-turn-helix domain-containing protein [Gammaproteobacteria bacterium]|nr:winged helix-turn-helix domain-containing protein [Gammaproteobacteria bacterium]